MNKIALLLIILSGGCTTIDTTKKFDCDKCKNIPECPPESTLYYIDSNNYDENSRYEGNIRILMTKCAIPNGDNEKIKHGKTILWFENGDKLLEREFFKDKAIGTWFIWYKGNVIKAKINYKNDMEQGLSEYFYRDGQKHYEVIYKDGDYASVKSWYKNKQMKYDLSVDNDNELHYQSWDKNGKLTTNIADIESKIFKDYVENIEKYHCTEGFQCN